MKKRRRKKKKKVLTSKTKSQLAQEARKEEPLAPLKEPSYPLMPSKKNKECYFKRFLEIFKELEITMPFGEALQQISLYTKFMKDILTKKEKYIGNESIMVGGNYNAMIQRKFPDKIKDPGSVTIHCTIGNESIKKAFIVLGANINWMPLSMCRRIGNLKTDPTKMML